MAYAQENILKKADAYLASDIKKIILFIALAFIAPALIHSQWITGPLINAILFLSVVYCGLSGAILVGIVPSVIALSAGLLPSPLVIAVPYIMVSNAILALVFSVFYSKGKSAKRYWAGVALSALLKFGFLFMATSAIAKFASFQIAPKIAVMFSWPQLATALAGGLIAFVVLKGN